jgi:hypothetical protein
MRRRRSSTAKAWHARSRSPSFICLDLSDLARSVPNSEVGYTTHEEYHVVVRAIQCIGSTKRSAWWAVGPFAIWQAIDL